MFVLILWVLTKSIKVITKILALLYPSGAPDFTPDFSGVRVTRSLVLFVCFVDRLLSFCTFSFGHCVICPSIYDLITALVSTNSSL
jgi:hypothetical protein